MLMKINNITLKLYIFSILIAVCIWGIILDSCSPNKSSIKCRDLNNMEIEMDFPYSKDTLYINIEGGFKNDSIIILIDKAIVTANTMSTDNTWGLAYSYKCPIRWLESNITILSIKENNECRLVIDKNEIVKTKKVQNVIGIFNRNNKLNYYLQDHLNAYE